jgi:hypothetical protein
MNYLIKVGTNPSYWSGKEDAAWVDQAAEAKEYATKKEADKEIKELAEAWGYATLEAVKAEDAPSAERPDVETEGDEAPAANSSLSTEDLKRIHS